MEYDLKDLVEKATSNFILKQFKGQNLEALFSEGREVEIMSGEGKKAVADAVSKTLKEAYESAKLEAREILIKKTVVKNILDNLAYDDQDLLDENNKLEAEYAEISRQVKKLENYSYAYEQSVK